MTEERFNKIFNIFILGGMTVCVILSTLVKMQAPDARTVLLAVTAFGALMGVASTVLAANGSIWNFLFGFLDVAIYSYILYDSELPAQFLLHVLYILPMEFVGFFKWRKRGAKSKKKVRTRTLKLRTGLYFAGLFVVVFGATYALSRFAPELLHPDGNAEADTVMVILDALVTTANIVALVMMAFAYVEQWYLWILVNICSVILWAIKLKDPGAGYALIPLVKYVFYFINALNGIRIWYRLCRENESDESCICE